MSSVMHTPRDHRPWGIVTWLADVFCLSRPVLGEILQEAFGQTRSASWLNPLLSQVGAKAGDILRQVDTSPLQNVVVMRDETFFQGQPLILIVEPVSSVILLAEVCRDRQADTWATALLMSQDGRATIGGLVEDLARMYPKSVKEAGLTAEAQKDCWHFQQDGGKVLHASATASRRHWNGVAVSIPSSQW
jgi:hypothetical protein